MLVANTSPLVGLKLHAPLGGGVVEGVGVGVGVAVGTVDGVAVAEGLGDTVGV
jgi:hypothetical protein